MSVEIYIFSNKSLNSTDIIQYWIDQSGFDLAISTKRDWAVATGHVSALWKGREAGFECDPARIADLEETYSLDFRGPWAQVLSFRFSTLTGCAGALIAGAVYASATDGVLFETEDLKFFKASEAIARARECEVEVMRLDDIQTRFLRKLKPN